MQQKKNIASCNKLHWIKDNISSSRGDGSVSNWTQYPCLVVMVLYQTGHNTLASRWWFCIKLDTIPLPRSNGSVSNWTQYLCLVVMVLYQTGHNTSASWWWFCIKLDTIPLPRGDGSVSNWTQYLCLVEISTNKEQSKWYM